MKKQILYITEHLSKILNKEQLQSIQKACLLTSIEYIDNLSNKTSFQTIEAPHIILGSENCLISAIKHKNYLPKSNFIMLGSHHDKQAFEKYKDKMNELRFILGDPPSPLLETILIFTINFFKNKETSDISKMFHRPGSTSLSFELETSKGRNELEEKISNFFKEQIEKNKNNLTIGASIYAKNLSDILEEFLMNAIWDANPKYSRMDRKNPLLLSENEKIDIFTLFDGINLVLSVTDFFGSFTTHAMQKCIQFALGIKKDNSIHEDTGGAGIGIFMVLQKIGILIFEIEKGKSTRATVIARGDQSFREMKKKTRTILFYEK